MMWCVQVYFISFDCVVVCMSRYSCIVSSLCVSSRYNRINLYVRLRTCCFDLIGFMPIRNQVIFRSFNSVHKNRNAQIDLDAWIVLHSKRTTAAVTAAAVIQKYSRRAHGLSENLLYTSQCTIVHANVSLSIFLSHSKSFLQLLSVCSNFIYFYCQHHYLYFNWAIISVFTFVALIYKWCECIHYSFIGWSTLKPYNKSKLCLHRKTAASSTQKCNWFFYLKFDSVCSHQLFERALRSAHAGQS